MATPHAPVLIVDDDEAICALVARTLEDAGYDVLCASDGARALDLIEAGVRPALILLDLMMPVMSGWEFWDLRQVTPSLRAIPVVIVTATGMTTGSVGDANVLSKPIQRAALKEAVASALAQPSAQPSAR